jgi:hypothetical protein
LKELWSDRLIEILIANPSKLYFGQEVLHYYLQGLYYDLGDMHTPYPNIEYDMEFTKVQTCHDCNVEHMLEVNNSINCSCSPLV